MTGMMECFIVIRFRLGIKARFHGKYPVRKSIQTEFAGKGLLFQVDAVAYCGK